MKRVTLFLVLALAACTGTSPEPDYYELKAVDGAPVPDVHAVIEVERPALAGYLDRPDFVRETGAYQYTINEFQWWAEPLDRMFERILSEDLRQRLPGATIVTSADTAAPAARYLIDINLQQFNAVGASSVALKVSTIIIDKTGAQKFAQATVALNAPGGFSPNAIANGLSDLLGAYADRLAAQFAPTAQVSAGPENAANAAFKP